MNTSNKSRSETSSNYAKKLVTMALLFLTKYLIPHTFIPFLKKKKKKKCYAINKSFFKIYQIN